MIASAALLRLLLIVLGLAATSCHQPEDATVVVLVGGTLEDGQGGVPLEYPVIVVEAGKIRDVGPQTHVRIPAGSRKVDTTGYILRPAEGAGPIVKGAPADLVLVDREGRVRRRMVQGAWQ